MSFGKDPNQIAKVMPFGQRLRAHREQAEQSRSKGGGGGGGSKYNDAFKPTRGDEPDLIRIFPGNYKVEMGFFNRETRKNELTTYELEYFPNVSHFDTNTNRSAVCSGGPFHNSRDRSPCRGCEMFYSRKSAPINKREFDTWNIIHIKPHHKVEDTDDKGAVRMNDKGEAWMVWVPCEGRSCQYCKQGKELKPAHRKHWSLSGEGGKILVAQNDLIEKSCASCGGRDTIESIAWTCQKCNADLIDYETTTIPKEQWKKLTSNPMRCPSCGFHDYAEENIKCRAPGCSSAKRATFFDVDLQVRSVETSEVGNRGTKKTVLAFPYFTAPKPIDAQYLEYAKPFELDKIFAPDSLEFQEKNFNLSSLNAPPQPTADQASRGYTKR